MSEKQFIIGRTTPITISLAVMGVGAAVWMTMLFAMANTNTKEVASLKTKVDQTSQDIQNIKLTLTEIKTILKERKDVRGKQED